MVESYRSIFINFMRWKDAINYEDNEQFNDEILCSLEPDDICRWMNLKAYGVEEPDSEARPTHCRSSTLEFIKKSISSFIPRRSAPWDPIRREGNPTRSADVNNLIKKVKKFEVRKQGVCSQARRAIEYEEFQSLLRMLKVKEFSESNKYKLSSILTLQWQLISRIDDMMKMKVSDISAALRYNFCLVAKMRWSKNITEERDAPDQIVLASMDAKMCPMLNLGVYMAMLGYVNDSESEFLFGNPYGGDRVVREMMNDIFESDEFVKLKEGKLGTHSIRKGPATYGSRCGLPKDYITKRGRWRGKRQMVDVYIDTNLPYPDARTAGVLCGPLGPCRYGIKHGFQVQDTFILEKVAHNISRKTNRQIAKVMGTAILWAAFDETYDVELLPSRLKQK
jgi:hypothetical protein